jgi:hypothetical protein
MITDIFYPFLNTVPALGSFITGANLIVIQHIFLSDTGRRKIGHNDIGACKDAEFTPARIDSSECCGSWQ